MCRAVLFEGKRRKEEEEWEAMAAGQMYGHERRDVLYTRDLGASAAARSVLSSHSIDSGSGWSDAPSTGNRPRERARIEVEHQEVTVSRVAGEVQDRLVSSEVRQSK
jgi:hypothetical protein